MTHYFIKEGKTEKGPFTLEQLREKPVEKDTKVWFAGLKEWTRMDHVYELNELFTLNSTSHEDDKGIFAFFRKLFSKKSAKQTYKVVLQQDEKLN